MKVIDLLNKIANKEEVPKKIKYKNYIYWYDEKMEDYKNSQVDYNSYIISCKYHNIDFLNDEVEIIEDTPKEDKKIEKMNFLYKVADEMQNANNERFKDFINEIVDRLNGE